MSRTRRDLKPAPQVPFQRIEGTRIQDPAAREAISRIQANVSRATDASRKQEDRGFKLITCKLTSSTTIQVAHGLGRTPKSTRLGESRLAAAAYEVVNKDSKFIHIKGAVAAGVSASVDLEIY